MKTLASLALLLSLVPMLSAQTPSPGNQPGQTPAAPADKLASRVYVWEDLKVQPTKNGVRRDVFDGPTTTLDKAHCHITTLNPGENSGEPRKHLQEEIIIVKEGTVEMHIDGRTQAGSPGSVFFLAANAVTALRNAVNTPATYIVVYYYTPLTPKS
jgi:quercetin dioxygenase-like cupin family protein